MQRRPRIALPAPTSSDLPYNRQCLSAYVTALEQSGGIPVEIPLRRSFREQLLQIATCDGFLLPGSPADVDPERYGETKASFTAKADPVREQIDLALLEDAKSRERPVLGICYGLQSINVWRGGTLTQHLPGVLINHAAGPSVAVAHTVEIVQESAFAGALAGCAAERQDAGSRVAVNSSHHQAVHLLGDSLRPVAHCPQDGVVEAIEGDVAELGFPVLAVQWHPERSFGESLVSRNLFSWLIQHASS